MSTSPDSQRALACEVGYHTQHSEDLGSQLCVRNPESASRVHDAVLAAVVMFHHIKSKLFLQIKAFNKLMEKAITGEKGIT